MADNDSHLEENYTVSFTQSHRRKKVIQRRIKINLKHTAVNNPLSAPSFAFMPMSIIHSYKQVKSLHGSISGTILDIYQHSLTSIFSTHFKSELIFVCILFDPLSSFRGISISMSSPDFPDFIEVLQRITSRTTLDIRRESYQDAQVSFHTDLLQKN